MNFAVKIPRSEAYMQNFINSLCFYLFVIAYIWGIILYKVIGFELIDEICIVCIALVFLYVLFRQPNWEFNKIFLLVLFIFLFYLIYSFKIGSNTKVAIIKDFFIQLKPYLAFFCIYQMRPVINEKQKKLLNQITLVCWFLLLPVGFYGLANEMNFVKIIGHPTDYAAAITCTALLYLFTSEGTKLNKLIFIGLLSVGIFSGRSKFYGFFVLASAITLYFNDIKRLKIDVKTIVAGLFIVTAIVFVAKDKILFYFMPAFSGDMTNDYIARLALYATSYSIFLDYFPFGSGFASFGTYYSGVYYSNIYAEYGIDHIWGLNKSFTSFVADTYYPSLAQFGIVGAVLYFLFWLYIVRKVTTFNLTNKNLHWFSITACIAGFLFIENIADASFTGNRGAFMMMFLGYVFSNLLVNKNEIQVVEGEKERFVE